MAPILNRALALAVLGTLAAHAGACAGATSQTRLDDPATLLAERDEWRGDKSGPVVLRMHVEALVDTRPDPSKAESGLVVHLVATNFGAAAPIPVSFPVPRGARVSGAPTVRFLTATPATAAIVTTPVTFAAPSISEGSLADAKPSSGLDPEQQTVVVALPAPPDGGVVEAILRFDVPGTLVGDARWVGLPGVPVGELLLRYDLPGDAVGTFLTTLPNAQPITTTKDGRTLIALLASNLPPLPTTPDGLATAPYARYVTLRASPKGYDQAWATDWATATAAYRTGLVDASNTLDGGYETPYAPAGAGRSQVLDAFAWVRARPMRKTRYPYAVRWDAARALPDPIAKNDLTPVDRVHLLHWVLREAKIAHVFLMARAGSRPPLDVRVPTPDAFEAPLVYVPDYALVLDPGCDACDAGQVRPELVGGQAIVVPVDGAVPTFVALPQTSPPPPTLNVSPQ